LPLAQLYGHGAHVEVNPGTDMLRQAGLVESRTEERHIYYSVQRDRGHCLLLKGRAMSAKVHLHMHVSDLSKSREFYEKFLGGDPVKVKPGYVKFLPEWAPVNLALSTGGHVGAGTIDHVGVQVDSVDAVMAQLSRIKAAGLPVMEEMGVNCCHANQDKFWVKDPDGVEWEVYHLNYDLEGDEEERNRRPNRLATLGATSSTCCGGSSSA
jgi:catechol 2,3-dioxygenase-like lactoylglutathione lyase family enzyme